MFVRRLFTAAVLVTAIASLPTTAAAQQIGVKAGVNFATLAEVDEFDDASRRIGLVAGLFAKVPVDEMFSFQIEGLYSEKGLTAEAVEGGVELDGEIRLRYLEVPVLGRADFGADGSPARFYAVAGAAPAFKLGARLKIEALDEEETEDIGDDIESFDLGLVGGIGAEFGNFNVEARYTHGMLSIAKDADDDDEQTKNRVFSVTAGYRFR
jgi:hypothetical protein